MKLTRASLAKLKSDLKKAYREERDETPIMEKLEDHFHIDLTHYYGEPDKIDELFRKLAKRNK